MKAFKNIISLFTIICIVIPSFGQNYSYRFTNSVYDEHIKSITFNVNNLPTNFPVIGLRGNDRLILKFDDLLNEERNYYYRIVHCNLDWTPSDLKEFDYINGFNDERLRNYEYSVRTKKQFIHYWQEFPNRDTKFNVSGNYLLIVYEESIDYPVLTRRFIVTESSTQILPKNSLVGNTANVRFNQEFQFDVNLEKLVYRDPQTELTLVTLQNENWDSYIARKPNFLSRNTAKFTTSGSFSYKGLSEYREFDTRGIQFIRRGVQRIERKKDGTDVLLTHTYSRQNLTYMLTFDFNGKFFINNLDGLNLVQTVDLSKSGSNSGGTGTRSAIRDSIFNYARSGQSEYALDEKNINADYLNIIFTLEMPENLESDDEVFILGSMNDWEPREEYRMTTSETGQYLTANVLLKQGYYNYYYGVLKSDGSIDYQKLEGSWNETENDYQVVAYFRGFGDIYDRVIGFTTFNTSTSLLGN
jgi:hypothetical protein